MTLDDCFKSSLYSHNSISGLLFKNEFLSNMELFCSLRSRRIKGRVPEFSSSSPTPSPFYDCYAGYYFVILIFTIQLSDRREFLSKQFRYLLVLAWDN